MPSPFVLEFSAGREAFGDGSHPSTKGALAALEALASFVGFERALDLGCGSGILALTMAYQWHIPVIAADLQAEAVEATAENAHTNGLSDLITAVRSDGFSHPMIGGQAPYDLICCNILAEKLVELAYDLVLQTTEETIVILSGILAWQAEAVMNAYIRAGLTLIQRLTVADWVTLVMQR